MDSTTTNAEFVRSAFERVFSGHRVDDIDRYFAEDFVQHSPYVAPGGREELKQWLKRTVTAIPDLEYEVNDIVSGGDDVVIFAHVKGTIEGDLPEYGIKGSGQAADFRTAHRLRVRDGRIIGHWEVLDTGPLVQMAMGTDSAS